MTWSTKQVADLAGTTVRAVRHYHAIGLLDEPIRQANGYKQYGVHHLVRLVRIKRLSELGFSLQQIADMGDALTLTKESAKALDAELRQSIEQMQQIRDELAALTESALPTDLPADIAAASDGMSEADRALTVVMTRILGPRGIATYTQMLQRSNSLRTATDREFDELAADADTATRRALAERMVESTESLLRDNHDYPAAHADAPGGERHFLQTVGLAMRELYNPAQQDVLARLSALLRERGALPP